MNAMTPTGIETVSAIIVTTPHPKKWPMSGMSAHTRTTMAIATGEGSPMIVPRIRTKTPAMKAMNICAPTNEPTRPIIAFVNFATRSRRLAGARRTPSATACGRDVMK